MLHGDPSPPKKPTFPTFWSSGDFGTSWKCPQLVGDSIGDLGTSWLSPSRPPKLKGPWGDIWAPLDLLPLQDLKNKLRETKLPFHNPYSPPNSSKQITLHCVFTLQQGNGGQQKTFIWSNCIVKHSWKDFGYSVQHLWKEKDFDCSVQYSIFISK